MNPPTFLINKATKLELCLYTCCLVLKENIRLACAKKKSSPPHSITSARQRKNTRKHNDQIYKKFFCQNLEIGL
eukprot:c21364_g2_i1 orf=28-249(-)